MAGLSYLTDYPPAKNPVVVVSPQFLAPYPVDLIITKKLFKLGETNFEIADVNGKIFFTLKSKFISLRDRRVLLDASGAPLLTLQQKVSLISCTVSFCFCYEIWCHEKSLILGFLNFLNLRASNWSNIWFGNRIMLYYL